MVRDLFRDARQTEFVIATIPTVSRHQCHPQAKQHVLCTLLMQFIL